MTDISFGIFIVDAVIMVACVITAIVSIIDHFINRK